MENIGIHYSRAKKTKYLIMNRRDSIRSLILGSMAGGLALESCVTENETSIEKKYGNINTAELQKRKPMMKSF